MPLKETIEADLKQAMRDRATLDRDTLRMVLAGLKNRRIEVGEELDEAQELQVLASAVKSRRDSAEQFDKGGRPELAQKERAEVVIIQRYLPQQLSEDETRAALAKLIDELELGSKKDMGALMKALMSRHEGRVDGKLAGRLANELLS